MLSLAAEPLVRIGPFTITNTLTNTLLVDALLIWLAWYVNKHVSLVPSKFQGAVEIVMEGFYNLTESVAAERTIKIFPYVMTFFLFILLANWTGLIPVITSVGFYTKGHGEEGFVHLFRSASTDLNTTLALALVSLVATHTMSIRTIGLKHYLGKFFSLKPLDLYAGLLELVSEFTKIISFSFRLFGNIFVGELILGILFSAFAFFVPIPVIMYELFVGVIQATIFALLTMAFMALFTTKHGDY
jgi:F-type H+-transporting ATPase subunit a